MSKEEPTSAASRWQFASRSVAFKVAKMSETVFKPEAAFVTLGLSKEALLFPRARARVAGRFGMYVLVLVLALVSCMHLHLVVVHL